jgi:hypothetical protein
VLTASLLEIVSTRKKDNDACTPTRIDGQAIGRRDVKLVVEPDQRVEEISLGRATLVRRIRVDLRRGRPWVVTAGGGTLA